MKPNLAFMYVLGTSAFAAFFTLACKWNALFEAIMRNKIHLTPDSELYKSWVRNPIPIYLEVYLYNWTNAEEFERNRSLVPHFKEVGPFLFDEIREKVDIRWDCNQETVTFNQSRTWRLLKKLSGNFEDKITNLNPIAATIAYMSRMWNSMLQKKIANALLKVHESLTATATVREWLFEGLQDEFLDMFKHLRKVTEIPIPYNRFGWFYERNQSSSFDGAFTMKTGITDRQCLGTLIAWNNKTKTEHYEGDCSLVLGNTGEIMAPLKPWQKRLTVFANDICSYVTLRFTKVIQFKGLEAYEFIGDESVFDNGTLYPENACFYSIGESCLSGTRNVSSCRFGSPAFISFPHFYLADSRYAGNINGMNPDETKHKFRLLVEPNSGLPLAVNASFQINFLVEPYEWCDDFQNFSKMFIPMLWFKQTAEISDDFAFLLKITSFFHRNGAIFLFALSLFIASFILLSLVLRSFKVKMSK